MWRAYPPILKTLVLHLGHEPLVAFLPFFKVTDCAFFISTFFLHLTQYASVMLISWVLITPAIYKDFFGAVRHPPVMIFPSDPALTVRGRQGKRFNAGRENMRMDYYEQFSMPAKALRKGRATLFTFKARKDRPGRDLTVAYDARHPPAEGFGVEYAYWIAFRSGGAAGGHYHRKKAEVFIPLAGSFSVELKDPQTGAAEELEISAKEGHALHVPAGMWHRVKALDGRPKLLVLASSPASEDDTFVE